MYRFSINLLFLFHAAYNLIIIIIIIIINYYYYVFLVLHFVLPKSSEKLPVSLGAAGKGRHDMLILHKKHFFASFRQPSATDQVN